MRYEVWGEPGLELPEGWLDEDDAQELRDRITELEAQIAAQPAADNAPPAPSAGSVQVAFDSHEIDHGTHVEIVPHYAANAEIDARRYRWLRDPGVDVALVLDKVTGEVPATEGLIGGGYKTYEYRSGVELDAAIDRAMGIIAAPPANAQAPIVPLLDAAKAFYNATIADTSVIVVIGFWAILIAAIGRVEYKTRKRQS
jgi:hypothetical protein